MLSLVNNLSALTAENNLSNANNSLNTTLQQLSSGLQINSGADNPAGLVISQEQQAQMSGLQAAITNTSNATNVVQTADGALNETNSLLLQIRGLVVSAANSGANDSNTLAADQAQIANALQTISSIATSTQYGNDQLLNGSHAVTASLQTSSSATVATGGTATGNESVALTGGASSGSYTATITSLATQGTASGSALTTTAAKASATAGTAVAGSESDAEAATVLAAGQYETLTINGTAINLSGGASGLTGSDALTDINADSSTTGVTASFSSSGFLVLTATAGGTAGNAYTVTDSGAQGTGAGTGLGFTTSPTAFTGGTSGNVLDAGQSETLTLNGTAINLSGGTSGLSDANAVTAINAQSSKTGVMASFDSGTGEFTLTSTAYGSAGNVAVNESSITGTGTGTGLGLTGTTTLSGGANVAGTMTGPNGSVTMTGTGNVLSGGGLSITTDPTGSTGTIDITVQSGASGTMSASGTTATASGTYTADITQLATQATLEGSTDLTGQQVVGANETDMLTINGVQIQLNGGTTGLDANGAAQAINQYSTQTGVKASVDTTGGEEKLKLTSTAYGSNQQITVEESGVTNPGNSGATIVGVGTGGLATATLTAGKDVKGTVTDSSGNNYEATGSGNVLTAANGLAITTDPNGSTGDLTTVVTNNSMQFQIGADAGQTATVSISNMQANAIGTGVTNSSGIVSLSQVDVTNSNQSFADILSVVDQAISQVSNLAGTLGAFQDNTLQATAANLQSSLQNTTAANSTIRDTNYATASANYAQQSVLVQAGTQVLKDANQTPSMVLTLLQQ
ncbi:MAG TPA: flagellin [Gemmataceae bacterium]|nr:flagellin [Gemmataceae bacterium]